MHAQHIQPFDLRATQLDVVTASTLLRLLKTALQIAKIARDLSARKINQDEMAEQPQRP